LRYYRYRRKASQRAKAIFCRILFILAAAALVTGLAILTGNLLLQKVDNAEIQLESSVPPSGNTAGRDDKTDTVLQTDGEYSTLQVFASGLDLTLHDTEESLFSRIHTISQTYNTVSVSVTGDKGLLYVSPALNALFRQPDTGVNTEEYTRLANMITAANARNLRLSAVLESSVSHMDNSTAALVDSTIAAELYVLGFDEILITDLLPADADTDAITNVRRYLQDVRNRLSGTGSFQVGACFPPSLYLDTENAKQVQLLSSAVDFLAMNISTIPVSGNNGMTLEEICTSLTGSFQVYNLRIVLDSDNPLLLSAQYNVLAQMELTNVHFISETSPETLTIPVPEEAETAPPETEAEETIPRENPYATTLPPDGTGNPTSPSAPQPEETYYRTEGGSWF